MWRETQRAVGQQEEAAVGKATASSPWLPTAPCTGTLCIQREREGRSRSKITLEMVWQPYSKHPVAEMHEVRCQAKL